MADDARAAILAAREGSSVFAAQWRTTPAMALLADRFAGVDTPDDASAAAIDLLERLDWFEAMVGRSIDALAHSPYFEPPLSVHRDPVRTGAVLFECRAARVTVTVIDGRAAAALPPARSVIAPGRLVWTRYVRSGGAHLQRWRVGEAGADFVSASEAPAVPMSPVLLSDDAIDCHDGRVEAQLLSGITGDVAMISVTLKPGSSPLMREYARSDGRLLGASTLDDRAARSAMLLRLLREQGRADAGDRFDAATRDPEFFLRWEAMREWLALDAAAALPRLAEMAGGDPHPEIRETAAGMLAPVRARLAAAATNAAGTAAEAQGKMRCPA